MEFIEAKIDPNSILKNALKEVEESSNSEGKPRIKKAEMAKPHNCADTPGMAVPGVPRRGSCGSRFSGFLNAFFLQL